MAEQSRAWQSRADRQRAMETVAARGGAARLARGGGARAAARGRAARAPAEVAVSLAVSFVRRGLRERGRPPLAGEQHAHLEAVCASVLESVGARIPEVVECLDTSRDVEDRTRKLEDLVVVLAEAVLASVLDTDAFPLARADDAKVGARQGPDSTPEARDAASRSGHEPSSARSARAAVGSRRRLKHDHDRNRNRSRSQTRRASKHGTKAATSSKTSRSRSATPSRSSSMPRAKPRSQARAAAPKSESNPDDFRVKKATKAKKSKALRSSTSTSRRVNRSAPRRGNKVSSTKGPGEDAFLEAEATSAAKPSALVSSSTLPPPPPSLSPSLSSSFPDPTTINGVRGAEKGKLELVENCSVKIVLLARKGFDTMFEKLTLSDQGARELGALRAAMLLAADRSDSPTVVDEAKVLLFALMCTRALCTVFDRIVEEHDGLQGENADVEANAIACLQLGCDLLNRVIHHSSALRSVMLETVALLFGRDAIDEVDREAVWIALEPFAQPVVNILMRHVGLTLTEEARLAWEALGAEDVGEFVFEFFFFKQLAASREGSTSSSELYQKGEGEKGSGACSRDEFEDKDNDEDFVVGESIDMEKEVSSPHGSPLHQHYAPEDAAQGGVDLGTGHERICVPQDEWRRLLSSKVDIAVPERGLEHGSISNNGHHASSQVSGENCVPLQEFVSGQDANEMAAPTIDVASRPRRISFAGESEVHPIPANSPEQNHKLWYSTRDIQSFLSDAQVLDDDETGEDIEDLD